MNAKSPGCLIVGPPAYHGRLTPYKSNLQEHWISATLYPVQPKDRSLAAAMIGGSRRILVDPGESSLSSTLGRPSIRTNALQ